MLRDKHGRRGTLINCEICNEEFVITPSRLLKNKHNTCSKKCNGILRTALFSQKVSVKCSFCEKEVLYKKSVIKQIAYPTCSYECMGKIRSVTYNKDNNPNALSLNAEERFFWERTKEIARRAKAANRPFDVDYKYLLELYNKQDKVCYYSRLPMVFKPRSKGNREIDALSVDKLVPELGYVKGNLVLCLNSVNMFKSNFKIEEIKNVIKHLYKNISNF